MSDPARHFDEVAELYDRARPRYPAELFDALELSPGLRVLEIGPGTGQATVPLAARGVTLTAYEVGPRLAAMTAAAVPGARVVNAPAQEADGSYDLVFGATSLHWLGDGLWPLAHRLLLPGGRLAVVGTVHVSDEAGDVVWHATQPVWRRHLGDSGMTLPRATELTATPFDTALFDLVRFAHFPRPIHYTGCGYADLIATFSSTAMLDEPARSRFLAELAGAVDQAGGYVRHATFTLTLLHRKETP